MVGAIFRRSRVLPSVIACLVWCSAAVASNLTLLSNEARSCLDRAEQDAAAGRRNEALARFHSLLLPEPITVGIDYGTIPSGAKGFVEGVDIGVDIWKSYIEDSPFVFSLDRKPNVLVRFVKQVPLGAELQGLIEARHEYVWTDSSHSSKLSATLYIAINADGQMLTRNQVAQVVGHELGHLLGLGDSSSSKGLMGPFNPYASVMSPSAQETQTVKEFRDQVRAEMQRVSAIAVVK